MRNLILDNNHEILNFNFEEIRKIHISVFSHNNETFTIYLNIVTPDFEKSEIKLGTAKTHNPLPKIIVRDKIIKYIREGIEDKDLNITFHNKNLLHGTKYIFAYLSNLNPIYES